MSSASRWRYRASDASGREAFGDLAAESVEAAVATLRARELWVIDLEPLAAGASSAVARDARGDGRASLAQRVTASWSRVAGSDLEALAVLTRAVATLLDAGMPLERALSHAADERGDSGEWPSVFGALRDRIRKGEGLAHAATAIGRLPQSFAPAFAAAESSGALPQTFERLATHIERQVRTRNAIRSALVYPTLLAVASLVGTTVILLVVVPRFAALLADSGVALPWATRTLVLVGAALTSGGWWLLGAIVLTAVLAVRWAHSTAGRARFHAARLGWPVIGTLERSRESARYLDSFALALGNGVPVLSSMRLARDSVENQELARQVEPAEAAVRDGAPVSRALNEWLPPLALRLLEAGESAGALAAMSQRAAEAADALVQRRVAQLVSVIEPLLILLFGGIVGFVALALLQAIYGLNAGQL